MSLTDRHAFIVAGQELAPPPGLDVTNHLDPDVLPFAGQSRVGRKVDELIIHESVTRSAVSTVAVLQRRKLGVHLIVAPDGRVFQHADLAHARLAHAGGHPLNHEASRYWNKGGHRCRGRRHEDPRHGALPLVQAGGLAPERVMSYGRPYERRRGSSTQRSRQAGPSSKRGTLRQGRHHRRPCWSRA